MKVNWVGFSAGFSTTLHTLDVAIWNSRKCRRERALQNRDANTIGTRKECKYFSYAKLQNKHKFDLEISPTQSKFREGNSRKFLLEMEKVLFRIVIDDNVKTEL